MDLHTALQNTTLSLLTTETPITTHNDTSGDDPPGGETGGWVLWALVSGSLFCFTALAVTAFILLVVLPRRG